MLFSILITVFFALNSVQSNAATGFTQDQTLYFTGTSSDPSTLYQDAMDGNLDAGIELCDVGSRYVGGFYALNDEGTWRNILVTYSTSTLALANADTLSSGCYRTSPGAMTVSPSQLTTPSPYVYKAAFPGKLFIGYATSANPGTVSNFVFANTNAQLLGDYTVVRTFDQTDRQITISTPTISFTTSSGTVTKSAGDASFGISSERRMVIGVCSDQYGESCSDGNVFTSASFPDFNTGLSSGDVNDQHISTRYVVLNGIGKQMCIGANLKPVITSITPDPVYYSQNLSIVITFRNPRDTPYELKGGNVDLTTDFDYNLSIYNSSNPSQVVYQRVFSASDNLVPDASAQVTKIWQAYAHSGMYTLKIVADSGGDVVECDETDNTVTDTFELKPITLPEIYIDGIETDVFDYPNVPYSLLFHLRNSDNRTLKNASVTIVEENGLNLMAPAQAYNITIDGSGNKRKSGLTVQNRVDFVTDYYGNASFTFIPTYNSFYSPEYDYMEFEDYVGGYSLHFEGTQEDAQSFVFIIDGNVSFEYEFSIDDYTYAGEYADKSLPHENMAGQAMDFIYHTFTNFLETVLGEI
ncbi:MAG: CARDB domain-containing protein [Candidatus Woesearchaeota archaeon]